MSSYSKYRAVRTTYNGRSFASKAEAKRAQELTLLLGAGEITSLHFQPTYHLGCPENTYRADFEIVWKDGRVTTEDVKGHQTQKFKHDCKLWKSYGPYPLHVLKRRGNGWQTTVIDAALSKARE